MSLGCTSSLNHTQPAEKETEAWNGRSALPPPPQLLTSSLDPATCPEGPAGTPQWAGGRGADPGGARRLIVGAELGTPPTPGASVHSERAPQTHHMGVAPLCFQRRWQLPAQHCPPTPPSSCAESAGLGFAPTRDLRAGGCFHFQGLSPQDRAPGSKWTCLGDFPGRRGGPCPDGSRVPSSGFEDTTPRAHSVRVFFLSFLSVSLPMSPN